MTKAPLSFRILVIVALCFGGASSSSAQPITAKPGLELRIELINQSYCAVSDQSTSLTLNLRLRYTNRSAQKIILYKGHDFFYQTRVRRVADGSSESYEVLYINSRYFDEEFEAIDRPAPGRVFVTMAPGEVHERQMTVGIGLAGAKLDRSNDAIRAGEHNLQLIASTWYKSWPLGEKLRERWRTKGMLWLNPLVSGPMLFVAERPQSLPACR